MNSSISSSEVPEDSGNDDAWRRFFRLALGTALCSGLFVYAFVAIVDPWDTLPLSPRLHRTPVSTNARFSFPALARSKAFDSAIFGTSTSRLLRPAMLNPAFGAAFANLSMNSATAYETSRLMEVFARAHPLPKAVMVGVDIEWCGTGETYEKYTPRPFPEWMYEPDPWPAYREIFNLYAVQEAGQQFAILTGIKKPRYGKDGYTNFLPDESEYDVARARKNLPPPPSLAIGQGTTLNRAALRFPTHALMVSALASLPASTRKLLFFVPYYFGAQPPPGSDRAATFDECKTRIAQIAQATPNTVVADFMIGSPITRDETHYWDPLHYRVPVADRLMADLADAARGLPSGVGDYVLLAGQR